MSVRKQSEEKHHHVFRAVSGVEWKCADSLCPAYQLDHSEYLRRKAVYQQYYEECSKSRPAQIVTEMGELYKTRPPGWKEGFDALRTEAKAIRDRGVFIKKPEFSDPEQDKYHQRLIYREDDESVSQDEVVETLTSGLFEENKI